MNSTSCFYAAAPSVILVEGITGTEVYRVQIGQETRLSVALYEGEASVQAGTLSLDFVQ